MERQSSFGGCQNQFQESYGHRGAPLFSIDTFMDLHQWNLNLHNATIISTTRQIAINNYLLQLTIN